MLCCKKRRAKGKNNKKKWKAKITFLMLLFRVGLIIYSFGSYAPKSLDFIYLYKKD